MKVFIKYRGVDLVCTISNHSMQWGPDEIDEDDFSIGSVTVEDSEIDIQELLYMDEIRDLIIDRL